MVGAFVCVFASTFFFVINHPLINNFNSVKRKNSANSHVCNRSLISSSFMRMYPFCVKFCTL